MIKKTVLIVGYRCNNRCVFCINDEKRHLNGKSTLELMDEMVAARKRGTTYLEMIGGEMTIRKDFFELVNFARKLGFLHVVMATNGRMFSYPKFAKDTLKAGITEIIFSIHGHNARLHDSLTRVNGSFKQLISGIQNVKNAGLLRIGSNSTIVRQNFKYLKDLGKLIIGLGIRNSEFIFVDPNYGGAKINFRELVPKISVCAPYIKNCLELGRKSKIPHWHVRYVPLCYFDGYINQVSEINEERLFNTEHIAPDFKNSNVTESRKSLARRKVAACKGCIYYASCEGIWNKYLDIYGDKEFNADNICH